MTVVNCHGPSVMDLIQIIKIKNPKFELATGDITIGRFYSKTSLAIEQGTRVILNLKKKYVIA